MTNNLKKTYKTVQAKYEQIKNKINNSNALSITTALAIMTIGSAIFFTVAFPALKKKQEAYKTAIHQTESTKRHTTIKALEKQH